MVNITEQETKKHALPLSAVSRIAKSNGVERIGRDAIEALAARTEEYTARIAKKATEMAAHAGRKTLKAEDIDIAVKSIAA